MFAGLGAIMAAAKLGDELEVKGGPFISHAEMLRRGWAGLAEIERMAAKRDMAVIARAADEAMNAPAGTIVKEAYEQLSGADSSMPSLEGMPFPRGATINGKTGEWFVPMSGTQPKPLALSRQPKRYTDFPARALKF